MGPKCHHKGPHRGKREAGRSKKEEGNVMR